MKKKLIVIGAAAIGMVVAVVLALVLRRSPESVSAPVTSAAPSSAPSVATPDQVKAFEALLKDAMKGIGSTPPANEPVTDKELSTLIREAQAFAVSEDCPTTLWKHEDVYRGLTHLGSKQLPVFAAPKEAAKAPLTVVYSFRQHLIYAWPGATKLRHDKLAQAFVHEVTHAVVRDELVRATGFTADELTALQAQCADIDVSFQFATEALANRNEALWGKRVSDRRSQAVDMAKTIVLKAALENEKGTAEAHEAYARTLKLYIEQTRALEKSRGARPNQKATCGPIVLLKGERRGAFFRPSDIAPDILMPLFTELH